jgi:predicted dehydrogenase
MQLAAKKYGVVTQMGNQIQSHSAYRTAVKYVQDGLIGKVTEVHSWQGGSPSWPRAIDRPAGSDKVPAHVRWDLWQGVADERPFKLELYHPFNWRGWQAYGTGQLGDFGCHILDPVFTALQLTAPNHLTAEAPELKPETWTDRATVYYEFPGTKFTAGSSLKLTWYDAVGAKPPQESLKFVPQDYKLPAAGSVLIGEKGSLLVPHVAAPKLFPLEQYPESKLETVAGVDHYVQWADACRGAGTATSHFGYSGPLTETVMLGTIGIRFPQTKLHWDAEALKITNSEAAQTFISKPYRAGWEPKWIG